jgi:hypothetical protein
MRIVWVKPSPWLTFRPNSGIESIEIVFKYELIIFGLFGQNKVSGVFSLMLELTAISRTSKVPIFFEIHAHFGGTKSRSG